MLLPNKGLGENYVRLEKVNTRRGRVGMETHQRATYTSEIRMEKQINVKKKNSYKK
jgi:hypothetical protein